MTDIAHERIEKLEKVVEMVRAACDVMENEHAHGFGGTDCPIRNVLTALAALDTDTEPSEPRSARD